MKFYCCKILLFVFILMFIQGVSAQPGCPDIQAGPDITLPCGTSCTNLVSNYFQTGSSSTYSVNAIPYTPFPYTGGTQVLIDSDDVWTRALSLPFDFCFFGNNFFLHHISF